MADGSDDAANGGVAGDNHTVYATTPEDVFAVLQRLEQNDPGCTSVVLTLAPPYIAIAERIAAAIKDNTFLTSLKLELDPGDIDEIVGEGGAVDIAVATNSSITVLAVKGAEIPEKWSKFCRRNTCLLIEAPEPIRQAKVKEDESIDLTTVPWAFPAGKEFDDLVEEEGDESDEDDPPDAAEAPRSDSDPWLGKGSYGAVYRVRLNGESLAAKTHFALQKPKMYGLANPADRKAVIRACMRELSALRRLQGHRNVVGFRGVAYTLYRREAMPTWICMDLAVKNLEARIKAGEVLFVPDMLDIVTGLEYIHSQGMIHRDVKPQNVLVSIHGWLMVADLGVTRVSHMLSKSMTAGGTPAYLAPDAQDSEYDTGRDVYAAGVMGMEMVLRESPAAVHTDRLTQVERAVQQWPQCAWVVRPCTAASSGDRPSCRGLQVALEALAADEKIQATTARADTAAAAAQEAQTQRARMENALAEATARATRASADADQAQALLTRELSDARAAQEVAAQQAQAQRAMIERAEAEASARAAEVETHRQKAAAAEAARSIAESEREKAEAAAAELAQQLTAQGRAAHEAEAQRARAAAELEAKAHEAQEAREANAELARRLAEAEQRGAEAEAAPRVVATVLSPPRTPDTPGQDALEAAMRILNHGMGPYPPCEEAVRLLRSAAAQGNPDALCELGVCLMWGRGVHINRAEAKERWREAVAKGSVEAAGFLAFYDVDYRRTAHAEFTAAVARWRERAAQGHADAQYYLGLCYQYGLGATKDAAEAVRWFQLCADQGCAAGQLSLGLLYEKGVGVPKDSAKAAHLYRLAADQGFASAQNNLGWYCEVGSGVRKNPAEALRLFRLSAEQGSELGQRHLGRCYMKGKGVKKDLVEARRWLTLSAEQGDSQARDLLAKLG